MNKPTAWPINEQAIAVLKGFHFLFIFLQGAVHETHKAVVTLRAHTVFHAHSVQNTQTTTGD